MKTANSPIRGGILGVLLLLLGPGCAQTVASTEPAARTEPARTADAAERVAPPEASGRGGETTAVPNTSRFPSKEQLDELAERTPPERWAVDDIRPVDVWDLAGPFPERIEAVPYARPEDPWDALLQEAARRRAGLVLPTEAMHCAARELGRFYLAHQGQPTPNLQHFIAARCNTTAGTLLSRNLHGGIPPGQSDADVFDAWREGAEEILRAGLVGGPLSAGIWFGREKDHAVAVLAYGERVVRVEPLDPKSARAGSLEIRGESLRAAAQVQAIANRGRFGVGTCEPVGAAVLPEFHLRCPLEPGDASAAISLSVTEPGRLLGTPALALLAWPRGETEETFRRPTVSAGRADAPGSGSADRNFVELLNRVRADAGLQLLALDPVQSGAASRLVPHFFAADPAQGGTIVRDQIVLGMLAGWSVDGIVQAGHVGSAWTPRAGDVAALLAAALRLPAGREVLLAPEVERIAVGTERAGPGTTPGLGALFGTYALFSEAQHDDLAAVVYRKLQSRRADERKASPERLEEVTPLCRLAASAIQGGIDPADALEGLLAESAEALQRPVSGWITEVPNIEAVEFPEDFVSRPSLSVAVSVTHRKPEGEAWGRYVVLMVVSEARSHGI